MLISLIEFIKDMFKYIIVIGVIILIRVYCLTSTEVVGPSMEPNLYNENMVLVETITPKFDKFNRFDMVVIEYSNPKYIIKRIVGLPNEKIRYTDNKLYVNDVLVEEKFKINGITEDFEITVPDGKYYVLGDNSIDSADSRIFGAVEENNIIGKPILKIWPLKEVKIIR